MQTPTLLKSKKSRIPKLPKGLKSKCVWAKLELGFFLKTYSLT